MTGITHNTADELARSAAEMHYMIARKQLRAVLEEMEVQWRKEHDRAECLYGTLVQVWRCADLALKEGDGKIGAAKLLEFVLQRMKEHADPVIEDATAAEVKP